MSKIKRSWFYEEQINSIHGPIGIKLGGRSAPEIALINNCSTSFRNI